MTVTERIAAITFIPSRCVWLVSEEIQAKINELLSMPITEEDFGEYTEEALTAKGDALMQLDAMKRLQREYDNQTPDEDGPSKEDIKRNAEMELDRRIDAADYSRER